MNVNGTTSDGELSLEIDWGSLANGNFEDVIKMQMTRISAFPDFVMEWVTRQIEEFVTKLTDFPTLYIILPQFDGVFDGGWGTFSQDIQNIFDSANQKSEAERQEKQTQIDEVQEEKNNST